MKMKTNGRPHTHVAVDSVSGDGILLMVLVVSLHAISTQYDFSRVIQIWIVR